MEAKEKDYILQIENLKTQFIVGKRIVKAVDGVSFELERTAAFGRWKARYDAAASKAYQKGGRLTNEEVKDRIDYGMNFLDIGF